MFLLFSIPIVTAPAAAAGLFAVARKYVYRQEPNIYHVFWVSFCENFKQSLLVGLALAVAAALLFVDFQFVYIALNRVFVVTWAVVFLVALSLFVHVYPLMVHMTLSTRQLFVNAARMIFIRPSISICNIALLLAMFFLSYVVPILFVLCFFSISATITYWMVNKKYAAMGFFETHCEMEAEKL
ncbi:DUF624 domain-containing protein [Alicyclobacillus fastidiosus]|uniref:DUF624 domain-containing protein n=1 Tax=Alicyclobacillus fastidiosus TaxID=392011 RepID=A0ABV5A944_9BACL|nr:DUF624 domain-containing protein [Alicyclobacillus fastidiosus]WEH10750.1 DUF624 domain-containing protein [Alicyclobacillus fastidiosus]